MSYRRSDEDVIAAQMTGCLFAGIIFALRALFKWLRELFAPLPTGIRVGRKQQGVGRTVGLIEPHLPRHVSIMGATGTGKTVTAVNIAATLAAKGYGLCVVDPKGGFSEALLPHLPPHRFEDVIVWEPWRQQATPLGFNLLQDVAPAYRSVAAQDTLAIFSRLYQGAWGVRQQWILRNCLLTLLEIPGSTLLDVPDLLLDADYRAQILPGIENFAVRHFWEAEYSQFTNARRAEAVIPLLNKLGPWLAYDLIRNTVGQPESSFNLTEIMDTGKILLVSLPEGNLGEDVSHLLAALLIAKLQLNAMARADRPETARRPFVLIGDEFQTYLSSSFDKIVTLARAMGLALVAINQFPEQLPRELALALEKNVAVRLTCYLEKGQHRLLYQQLQDTGLDDIVVVPDPPRQGGQPDLAAQIRHYTRQRYGRPRVEVETAIRQRRQARGPNVPGARIPWDETPQDAAFWEDLVIRQRGAA